ncbi:MAG: dihydroorotase, partial [Elusimicrobiota bacterium]
KIEFIAAVTQGRRGKTLTNIQRLAKLDAAAFSDDGSPVANERLLKQALEETRKADSLVMDHAEDLKLSANGVINEGKTSRRLKLPGIPRESEIAAVRRDLKVLKTSRGRLHLCHISTKEAVNLIRQAKTQGMADRLSAEACPHHFALTDEAVINWGPLAKVNPPLRTAEDVQAVREGLADGAIDAIASDHAPHTNREKSQGMKKAPFGLVGLETLLPATITYLVKTGSVPLHQAIRLLTVGPARILGRPAPKIEPGEPADLIIFDPNATVIFSSFASKSQNSPFLGQKLYGRVLATIHRGRIVYRS